MVRSDSAGIEIVQYRSVPEPTEWELAVEPLVSVGLLDGPDPYLFSNIGHVRMLSDDRLIVSDRLAREVRIFDPDGSFLGSFGGHGEGPGEFQNLTALGLRGDTIQLWDSRLGRLTLFASDGQFLASFRPEFVEVEAPLYVQGFFADGGVLALVADQGAPQVQGGVVRTEHALVHWNDAAPNRLDTLALLRVADVFVASDGIARPIPLMSSGAWVAGDRTMYVTDGHRFEFHSYAQRGGLQRIVRADETPVTIGSDFFRRFLLERVNRSPAGVQVRLREAYDEMPFPEHFPVIEAMLSDEEGNVWVKRYSAPPSPAAPHEWHGFDGTGLALGTLRVPAAFSLHAVNAGRAVGVWEADDGVPMARVYEISRE